MSFIKSNTFENLLNAQVNDSAFEMPEDASNAIMRQFIDNCNGVSTVWPEEIDSAMLKRLAVNKREESRKLEMSLAEVLFGESVNQGDYDVLSLADLDGNASFASQVTELASYKSNLLILGAGTKLNPRTQAAVARKIRTSLTSALEKVFIPGLLILSFVKHNTAEFDNHSDFIQSVNASPIANVVNILLVEIYRLIPIDASVSINVENYLIKYGSHSPLTKASFVLAVGKCVCNDIPLPVAVTAQMKLWVLGELQTYTGILTPKEYDEQVTKVIKEYS